MRRFSAIILVLGFVAAAHAQTPSPTPESGAAPASPETPATKLEEQQAAIRERVLRLEDRLFQLNQAIRKSEPEKAARLLETLGASRSLMVRQKMDEIIKKLEDKQFADALDKEQLVASDLQALLKGLLEEPDHSAQRKEETDKLKAFRKALDNIIEEQKKERNRAAEVAEAEDSVKRVKAAKERIMDLAQKQAAIRAQSKPGSAAKEQAPKQKELSEQAQKAAESLTPSGETDPAFKDASESVKKAADQMKSAQESLEKNQADSAQKRQKSAEDALQAALDKLDKSTKGKLQTLKEQAEEQEKTAAKTEQLSKEDAESKEDATGQKGGSKEQKDPKQSGDQKPSGGDQKPSSESDSKQQDQQQPPGKKSVKEAVPQQREAAEELRKKDAKKAVKKQDEALKKLEQAKEELEDRLEQLRKEQQEELLAALETRFRSMLARQVECTKGTRRLSDMQREKWKRTDQLALADLSNSQRGIGDEAEKALYILREEGTTVIFPQIIEQVRDDSRDAGEKLAAAVVGLPARTLQEGIEQALRELLDAIKKKQEENESGEGSGSGGDQGNPPLLPSSAELKLLRSCQIRVNKMTDSIRTQRQELATGDQLNHDLQKLSQRQQQVSEMARQMHESMTKPQ
jgi:hypothetical protein